MAAGEGRNRGPPVLMPTRVRKQATCDELAGSPPLRFPHAQRNCGRDGGLLRDTVGVGGRQAMVS